MSISEESKINPSTDKMTLDMTLNTWKLVEPLLVCRFLCPWFYCDTCVIDVTLSWVILCNCFIAHAFMEKTFCQVVYFHANKNKTKHVTLCASCLKLALLFFRSLDKTLIVSAIFILWYFSYIFVCTIVYVTSAKCKSIPSQLRQMYLWKYARDQFTCILICIYCVNCPSHTYTCILPSAQKF